VKKIDWSWTNGGLELTFPQTKVEDLAAVYKIEIRIRENN
jgi:hypothetical protein